MLAEAIHILWKGLVEKYELKIGLLLGIAAYYIFPQGIAILNVDAVTPSKLLQILRLSLSLNMAVLTCLILLYWKHRFIRKFSIYWLRKTPYCPVCEIQMKPVKSNRDEKNGPTGYRLGHFSQIDDHFECHKCGKRFFPVDEFGTQLDFKKVYSHFYKHFKPLP